MAFNLHCGSTVYLNIELSLEKFRTFALLLCVITFTTLLFSYTFRDPSLYFFKYFRLSDSFFSKGPCSCRQCVAELEGDPWFAEHFNLSIHPLMTRENSFLSEETFKWWQWLQSERQPANFSEVVEELFQVIPDGVLYVDASPERCRSCAVVGNSGNLKRSRYGGLIDACDFIIRMNQAPTSGFEEDVGTRTTHHVMYPESAIDLDNTTSLVLIPFKTLDLQWVISALTTADFQIQNNDFFVKISFYGFGVQFLANWMVICPIFKKKMPKHV
uniref:Uncharacterized protein n=1 Tax=Xiphophorus couchianus TaxID=32473 RepID=A0A3B5L9S5_9TELE